jgi:hypothetical protein
VEGTSTDTGMWMDNTKFCESKTLYVVLYGFEMWSFTLREIYRLRVSSAGALEDI